MVQGCHWSRSTQGTQNCQKKVKLVTVVAMSMSTCKESCEITGRVSEVAIVGSITSQRPIHSGFKAVDHVSMWIFWRCGPSTILRNWDHISDMQNHSALEYYPVVAWVFSQDCKKFGKTHPTWSVSVTIRIKRCIICPDWCTLLGGVW